MGFRSNPGQASHCFQKSCTLYLSITHLSLCHHLSLHATILPREFPYLTHSGTMRMVIKILISLCRTWLMSNKETHFKKSPFNRVNKRIMENVVLNCVPFFFILKVKQKPYHLWSLSCKKTVWIKVLPDLMTYPPLTKNFNHWLSTFILMILLAQLLFVWFCGYFYYTFFFVSLDNFCWLCTCEVSSIDTILKNWTLWTYTSSGLNPAWPFTSCVPLRKLLNLSRPPCSSEILHNNF